MQPLSVGGGAPPSQMVAMALDRLRAWWISIMNVISFADTDFTVSFRLRALSSSPLSARPCA